MKSLSAGSSPVTLHDVANVARNHQRVLLPPYLAAKLEKSRAVIAKRLAQGEIVYGISTGFGKLADQFIQPNQIKELQKNLLLSHAVGVGDPFPNEIVRAMLFLRLESLAKGYSGVRPLILEYLVRFLNEDLCPLVPSQGSVGSSGDLAPLAHLCLPLLGEGQVMMGGEKTPARLALQKLRLPPLHLEAKEGLGLINGTQAMSAIGALALFDAETVLKTADIAAAMSLEATLSSSEFLHEKLHAVRPHPGQIQTAKNLRQLIAGSKLVASHKKSLHRIQDAYSIRCIPQVHGAVSEAYRHARKVLETEINSVTDNPLVFPESHEILSGGNFHGHPVALALDFFKIALAGLSNISERRIERLVNPALSEGLPPFLVRDSGTHSGMMVCQYSAASLVSENKVLSHPASVDSIPTSANQEDYNSMGTLAARNLAKMIENTTHVLMFELLCAAQALEFRRPLRFGAGVEEALAVIRRKVPPLEKDRFMQGDLAKIKTLIQSKELVRAVEGKAGAISV